MLSGMEEMKLCDRELESGRKRVRRRHRYKPLDGSYRAVKLVD